MITALALALGLFEGGARAISGAAPPPGLSLSAESCGDCHARELAAWRGSRHRAAWTNPSFAASYAREPLRWCLYCHAPLPEQIAQIDGAREVVAGRAPLADEGVGCAACHLRDGVVLGARTPSRAALAAHPVRVEPRLGSEEACAGCHQFAFPRERRPHVEYTDEPMQDTVAEWRRSGTRERCQDCHMPKGAHSFRGGRDLAWLRESIDLQVRGVGRRATVTLRAPHTPHRTPTGDPFRRLWVELCADDACEQVLARPAFGRSFRRDGDAWRLFRDGAVAPFGTAVRTVELEAPLRAWRLVYGYVAPSTEAALPAEEIEQEIARGRPIDARP